MIKRMSKATSILLAAAAVMSLAPSVGANAATIKTLDTQEGTISKAVAYADGKYIFEGYKTADSEDGLYYNNGTTDKAIDNINASSIDEYSSKYAKVEDGSDEYLIDLSNGTVSDQDTTEVQDYVTTKLKSTLSKTDRYGTIAAGKIDLNPIAANEYGQVWYTYDATTSSGAKISGYVNDAGKYIDADVTANMYVQTGSKTIKVTEFGKANSNSDVVVTLDKAKTKELAQDNDYLYRLVTVNITGTGTKTPTATYIQKISKAQGSTKDEAYLPNSVTSYEVSKVYDSSNADAAVEAIVGGATEYSVVNGTLYAINNTGDNVSVTTVKLTKDKVGTKADKNTKLDLYLAEKDVKEDQDIKDRAAVSIDVDGYVWAVDGGNIYKFDGTDFVKTYKVDSSIDRLSVYNTNSLIAWKDGSDIFAAVNNKAEQTPAEQTPPVQTPAQNKGWVKTDAGWTFYNTDGSQVKGQWVNDNGTWYMIKADGIMATGWYNDNGTWYFLNASGAMRTGWFKDTDGNWYFLKASGAMATGWYNDNGTWYFLRSSGAMAYNTVIDGYKLNASGAWVY